MGNGGILYYTDSVSDFGLVPPDGGTPTALPLGPSFGPARWPEFLPDGRHLLLQVRSQDPALRGVYLRTLDAPSAEPVRLAPSDFAARVASGYLRFLDGGTLMVQPFDTRRNELSGAPRPVVRGVGASSNGGSAFSVSTTGVLAYAGATPLLSELRWVDRQGRPGPVVAPSADYVDLHLSHDQTRLVFAKP